MKQDDGMNRLIWHMSRGIEENNAQMVRWAIGQGVNFDSSDLYNGGGPLHRACGLGRVEMVRILLDHFLKERIAGVIKKDNGKSTPLHIAAKIGDPAVIDMLVKAGAWLDEIDGLGRTPLFVACLNNHTKTAIILVEAGANIWSGRHLDRKWIELLTPVAEQRRLKRSIETGLDGHESGGIGL